MTIRLFLSMLLIGSAAAVASAQDPVATAEFEKAVYYGKLYFEHNDYPNAYEQFAKADALQPDHPAVLYNQALLLAKIGRYSEAQVKVDRYLQVHPSGVERPLVIQLEFHLGFQREWQRTRRIEQEYSDLFTKGLYLYSRNDLEGALKLFIEAEQKRPQEAAAVFNQAIVHEKRGDFQKAAERFRRYRELESDPDQKAAVDVRIVALEGEYEDVRTKIVCSFCGHKLPADSTWCHRCWHGPYMTSSPVWNSRPCIEGASATRASFFSDDRFHKNESLPCIFDGTVREALRYSPAQQSAIQDARKTEGWTYNGDLIQGWRDKNGNEIRYVQGPEYLERIDSPGGGEILTFSAHQSDSVWLLDSEQWLIDGQYYTSRFTFDADNRISRQQVEYQNAAACNHLITMAADYRWEGNRLAGASISGGYDGFVAEGAPRTDWHVTIVNTFDNLGRLTKEDLTVDASTKTYMAKPTKREREQISAMYRSMRIKKPIPDVAKTGDHCAIVGGRYVANLIDLRPFYPISPNVAMLVPLGVTRVSVTLAYPHDFKP